MSTPDDAAATRSIGFRAVTDRPEDIPIRDAATVILVRDGDDGVEVLMMLRTITADFVGGAYVFPGGAVDAADGSPEYIAHCADLEPERELVARIGGIRETFEEAGLLLARDGEGRWAAPGEDWATWRTACGDGGLARFCAANGWRLAVDECLPVARWLTPLGSPRRYDTRFYVCAAPDGQVATADDAELTTAMWITPRDVLRRHDAGELQLIFPTVMTLREIEGVATAAEVLAKYGDADEPEVIEPRFRMDGETPVVILPDGREYDGVSAEPL